MLTLGNIMATTAFRVDADTSVREAARIMGDMELGSILITREGKIEGIVTETDMVRRVLAQDMNPDSHKVDEVMSFPLLTADVGTTVDEAKERMDRERIRHLLVTEGEEIRGIVSIRDLIHKPRLTRS